MSYLSKVVVRDREEIKQMEGNSLLTEMGRKNLKLIADPSRVCWEIFRLFYPSLLGRNQTDEISTIFSPVNKWQQLSTGLL